MNAAAPIHDRGVFQAARTASRLKEDGSYNRRYPRQHRPDHRRHHCYQATAALTTINAAATVATPATAAIATITAAAAAATTPAAGATTTANTTSSTSPPLTYDGSWDESTAANVDDSLPAHSLELEKVGANVTTPEPFMSSDDAQEDIEEELYLYFKRKFRYA
ncbi:hypothetical protein HDU80_010003 [Chytriomyces hyalinus]|nr:hypothetical protein HDU80_010003 [Chytriomyces hyalinus]